MTLEYHFGCFDMLGCTVTLIFAHQDNRKKLVYFGTMKGGLLIISLTAIRISMKTQSI